MLKICPICKKPYTVRAEYHFRVNNLMLCSKECFDIAYSQNCNEEPPKTQVIVKEKKPAVSNATKKPAPRKSNKNKTSPAKPAPVESEATQEIFPDSEKTLDNSENV